MKNTNVIIFILAAIVAYLLWSNYASRNNGKPAVVINDNSGIKRD